MLLCDSQLGGYTCFGKYMGHSSVEQTWNYIRDIVEAKEKSLEAQIFNSSRIPARARDGARRPVDVCFAPTGAERRPNPPLAILLKVAEVLILQHFRFFNFINTYLIFLILIPFHN